MNKAKQETKEMILKEIEKILNMDINMTETVREEKILNLAKAYGHLKSE